jgi:hypothetical protein
MHDAPAWPEFCSGDCGHSDDSGGARAGFDIFFAVAQDIGLEYEGRRGRVEQRGSRL